MVGICIYEDYPTGKLNMEYSVDCSELMKCIAPSEFRIINSGSASGEPKPVKINDFSISFKPKSH